MKRLLTRVVLLAMLAVVGIASPGAAQGVIVPAGGGGAGGTVNVTGVGPTTQDTDDGSIATSQSVDLVGGFTMVYDGSVWRRLTFGTAGTASTQVLTVQGIASMTALSVTFPSAQAVTQSGTWNITNVSGTVSLPTGASTAANQATLNTVVGDSADAAATAGSTGTVSAKLRLATDLLNQINTSLSLGIPISNGSTTDTDDGTIAGSQSSVALTAAVGYGYDGTNNIRVRAKASTPGSTEAGLVTRPLAATDGTNTTPTMDAVARPGFQKITDGTNTAILDPCESSAATISYVPVAVTATSVLKTGTASKKTYVCGLFLMAAAAENFSIIEGTGSTCGTSTLAVVGSTSAAAGMNIAANGGFVLPTSKSSWASTTVNANDLCLIKAGAVQVSGVLKVAVQ